jgi:peptidoglycan/xylan/chitin deacetylase (PgdA/CDA1 family)
MGNPLKPGYPDTASLQWAEYALKKGIYRMLDIAESCGVKVTSSTSGIITEKHPAAIKRLHSGGHEIQSHCWAQGQLPVYMKREEEEANLKKCLDAFEKCIGIRPAGFGTPRGTVSANTVELLAANGVRYYNDDMSTDMPYIQETPAGPVAVVPYGMEVNDLPFHMRHGNPLRGMTDLVADIIKGYPEIGMPPTILDVTFHAQVAGRIVGAIQFKRILDMITKVDWMWVTTRGGIADLILPPKPATGVQ